MIGVCPIISFKCDSCASMRLYKIDKKTIALKKARKKFIKNAKNKEAYLAFIP